MILTRVEKDKSIDCLYDSSNILASSYNKENNDLTVTFKRGTQYIYRNVQQRDYVRFEAAESQGAVLNTHIKAYPFIKGDDINVDSLIREINQTKPKEMSEKEKELITNLKQFIQYHEGKSDIELGLVGILEEQIKLFLTSIKPQINE